MPPKIGIVVFSGLPAAGKTTLARKLMLFCETEPSILTTVSCKQTQTLSSQPVTDSISEIQCIHVCYDDIMTDQLYDSNSEENAWKIFRKYIRLCVELEITELLDKGLLLEESKETILTVNDHFVKEPSVMESSIRNTTGMYSHQSQIPEDILLRYMKSEKMKKRFCDEGDKLFVFLIDDNMFLRSMRYEYYQVARKYGTGFCQVSIRCSLDEAQQQNTKRNTAQCVTISKSTIVTMARKFEVPDIQNHWEALSILLDRESCCNSKQMCEVWQLIIESIYQPVDKLEEIDEETRILDRLICSQNVLHQVDQILRREIGRQLKAMQSEKMINKEDLRKQATLLNEKKSSMLELMRTGKIGLPKYLENHIKDACKDEKNPLYIYIKEAFEA